MLELRVRGAVKEHGRRDSCEGRAAAANGILTHRVVGDGERGARRTDPDVIVGREEDIKTGRRHVGGVGFEIGRRGAGVVDAGGGTGSGTAQDGITVRLRDNDRAAAAGRQVHAGCLRVRAAVVETDVGDAAHERCGGAKRNVRFTAGHLVRDGESGTDGADPDAIIAGDEDIETGACDVGDVGVQIGGGRAGAVGTDARSGSRATEDGIPDALGDDGGIGAEARQRDVRHLRVGVAIEEVRIGNAGDFGLAHEGLVLLIIIVGRGTAGIGREIREVVVVIVGSVSARGRRRERLVELVVVVGVVRVRVVGVAVRVAAGILAVREVVVVVIVAIRTLCHRGGRQTLRRNRAANHALGGIGAVCGRRV